MHLNKSLRVSCGFAFASREGFGKRLGVWAGIGFLAFFVFCQEAESATELERIRRDKEEGRGKIIEWALDYQETLKKISESEETIVLPKAVDVGVQHTPVSSEKKVVVAPPSVTDRRKIIHQELDRLELSFQLHTGLRRDDFQWSIAGSSGSPNILSELTWKELISFQFGGNLQALWDKRFRLETALAYGWIYDGRNQDSDYLGDDRTLEFSRSSNASKGDNTYDFSIALGYQFPVRVPEGWETFLTEDLNIVLLGGYAYNELNMRMTEGWQDIPATGAFSGLNSTFKTEWEGPWFGVELTGRTGNFQGFSRFEYHLFNYAGVGDWNLRTDFAHPRSFDQTSSGNGLDVKFGGALDMNENSSLGLLFNFRSWKAGSGSDTIYWADGTSSTFERFNVAEWRSWSGMVTFTFHLPDRNKKKELISLQGD